MVRLGNPVSRPTPVAFALLALFALLLGGPAPARADIVYLYDDLGRLVRVIQADGQTATWHYDAVGNLVQITRETGVAQTTTVTSTSATFGGQDVTVSMTITGSNLIGASVACITPGIAAQNVRSDFDQLTLELVISATAPVGPAQCQVNGITVVAFPFTVTQRIFFVGPAVSVAVGTPLTSNNSVLGAVSVAVGRLGAVFEATAVAVAFTPVITGVSPDTGSAGTPNLVVTLTGAGFTGATGVDFFRGNTSDPAITVTTFSVNSTGTTATVEIAIAPGAVAGPRVVRITTPTGQSTAVGTGGNFFTVQ